MSNAEQSSRVRASWDFCKLSDVLLSPTTAIGDPYAQYEAPPRNRNLTLQELYLLSADQIPGCSVTFLNTDDGAEKTTVTVHGASEELFIATYNALRARCEAEALVQALREQ